MADDMSATPEPWFSLLTDEANLEKLRLALKDFPPGGLAHIYKRCFDRNDQSAWRLVRTPWNAIQDHNILENLGRIRGDHPAVLEAFAKIWLKTHEKALHELAEGKLPEGTHSPDWLEVAFWLWQNTDSAIQPTWETVARWVRPVYEQSLSQANQSKAVGDDLSEARDHAKRLEKKLAHAEKDQESLHHELRESKNHRATQDKAIEKLQAQLSEVMGKLEQAQKQVGESTTRWQKAERDLQDHRTKLFEQDREVTRLYKQNTDQLARIGELGEIVAARDEQIKQITSQMQKLTRTQAVPLPGQILEQALIIDYLNLADTPLHRLMGLLELYRAFLDGKPHPLLERHTNWPEFKTQPPRGLLLLGLEQLLLDGVNLPLLRMLKTATFQVEGQLQALLGWIESPRLQEAH